jgi:hypothetical protein
MLAQSVLSLSSPTMLQAVHNALLLGGSAATVLLGVWLLYSGHLSRCGKYLLSVDGAVTVIIALFKIGTFYDSPHVLIEGPLAVISGLVSASLVVMLIKGCRTCATSSHS